MNSLKGRSILVVEDEWMLARDLLRAFETTGAHVIGPIPNIDEALQIINGDSAIDAAVVDLTLRGEKAYPVVDALESRKVPYIFATGLDWDSIPMRFRHVPTCVKPYECPDVAKMLSHHLAIGLDANSALNEILKSLSPADHAVLKRYLEPIDLPRRMTLEYPGRVIEHCYFPSSGVVSVVAHSKPESVEIALIGREGVTGLSTLWGNERGVHEVTVLVEGEGARISVSRLREVAASRPGIASALRKFEVSLQQQFAETALAASRFTLEQRLARWLLLLGDRAGTDELAVTHEITAWKLGVRRAGVTQALRAFSDASAIRLDRGLVIVENRDELVRVARGAYSGPV